VYICQLLEEKHMPINWISILKIGLPIVAFIGMLWFAYHKGELSADAKWKIKYDKMVEEKNEKINIVEEKIKWEVARVENEAATVKEELTASLDMALKKAKEKPLVKKVYIQGEANCEFEITLDTNLGNEFSNMWNNLNTIANSRS